MDEHAWYSGYHQRMQNGGAPLTALEEHHFHVLHAKTLGLKGGDILNYAAKMGEAKAAHRATGGLNMEQLASDHGLGFHDYASRPLGGGGAGGDSPTGGGAFHAPYTSHSGPMEHAYLLSHKSPQVAAERLSQHLSGKGWKVSSPRYTKTLVDGQRRRFYAVHATDTFGNLHRFHIVRPRGAR